MRVEPYSVGSILHVVKRGARGMPITGDEADKHRFLRALLVMNDRYFDENWEEYIDGKEFGHRPAAWPERKPLVNVLAYTLLTNHFHLLVEEVEEEGVSTFMKKLGQSMSQHFNLKYRQSGSLFQGSYRSRTIGDDRYFQYVVAYVLVKNTFELYPRGGLKRAQKDFESAWAWAIQYPFSSLGTLVNGLDNPITNVAVIGKIMPTSMKFKRFAKDVILGGTWGDADFE